jgi:DNA-binding NarL/FixJ family response regulator
MDNIKVAITDDHKLFREGVRACLQSAQNMHVMMEAENGQDLLDKLAASRVLPEVILLDLRMPLKDGFETTGLITKKYPKINIIVLTMHDEIQFVRRIYELGAKAYLLKNAEPVEIRNAIIGVMNKTNLQGKQGKNSFINKLQSRHKFTYNNIKMLLYKTENRMSNYLQIAGHSF